MSLVADAYERQQAMLEAQARAEKRALEEAAKIPPHEFIRMWMQAEIERALRPSGMFLSSHPIPFTLYAGKMQAEYPHLAAVTDEEMSEILNQILEDLNKDSPKGELYVQPKERITGLLCVFNETTTKPRITFTLNLRTKAV